MKKIPDVLFVVDGVYEQQAIKEANSLKLKSFAILNTNGDDTIVDNLIPANTNSVKSTEFIANTIKSELV
jgi:small subunit ribosomal protein S2